MESIPQSRPRSKKAKRLGPVRVIRPEQYEAVDVNSKVECIQALIPLGLMRIQELLEEEVYTVAGARYARKASHLPGYRHGSNPGSVQLAGQRHPVRIPRVQHVEGGEISLQSLGHLRGPGQLDEGLLKRVLYGMSCRTYEAAAAAVPGAIGLLKLDGVSELYASQRQAAPGVSEPRPERPGHRCRLSRRESLRRHDDGDRRGHHAHGGETRPGVCGNGD